MEQPTSFAENLINERQMVLFYEDIAIATACKVTIQIVREINPIWDSDLAGIKRSRRTISGTLELNPEAEVSYDRIFNLHIARDDGTVAVLKHISIISNVDTMYAYIAKEYISGVTQ